MIDQHAAHERLRFIELSQRTLRESQTLLIPATFDVPPDRAGVIEALLPELNALGFALEPFGGATWAVTAVPTDMASLDPVALMTDVLDEFDEAPKTESLRDARDRLLIRAACHSSIRAGNRLNRDEMQALLDQMRDCRLSFTCPHGRPTILRLSRHDLDKRFGRLGA